MKILVDVMSGDNAPLELIKGAAAAHQAYDEEIFIIGDENIISDVAVKNEISLTGIQIINSQSVITMEDKPMCVVREKRDSSMSMGLKMLANGEVDAFVSAGNQLKRVLHRRIKQKEIHRYTGIIGTTRRLQ